MTEESKEKLRAAGRQDLIDTYELMTSGYGGINQQGTIVDRRIFPDAVPFQENPLFNTPKAEENMRYKYEWQLIGFGKYKPIQTVINEPRPNGYYWVRHQGKWQIAEWYNEQWCFLGDIGVMADDHFDKIHEEPIEEPPYD